MWNQKPSFRFEINNFSEKEAAIKSQTFVSGGCEWYLKVYPKGDSLCDDHLSLYLYANSSSLGRGWKRSTNFYFVLLNQSDKEISRTPVLQKNTVFRAKYKGWGIRKTLPLSKFQEEGFLENDRLIIEVYIKIAEAFDGEGGDVSSEKNDTVDINGFQVLASQVTPVRKIFAEHPDLAEDFKPKNQVVKTVYMNVLLSLIETLHKPSQNHSETELSNAHSDLGELMEMGFKLDWLKSKLNEGSLDRKKSDDADGSQVKQLEERVKNLELMGLEFKTKLEEVSLERKKSDDADGFRVQQLEKRVNNLELVELEFMLDSLKRKKSDEADGFRVQQLEKRVKNLELMELDFKLDCLKSKLEEVSLDKKKADADGSRVQQLEESVKNLEMMVSDLKVELDKEKAKSSADGFLLVD